MSPGGISPGISFSHRHSLVDYLDLDNAFGPPRTQNTVETTALQAKFLGAVASNEVEVGGEISRDALDNTGFGFRQRGVGSLFAHDTLQAAPGLQLFADGRFDASNLSGSGFSPRAGLAWKVWDRHRLRALVGQSYRAPTFNDLYWPTSRDAAGNPALRPEMTRTLEAGFDSSPVDSLTLKTSAYLNMGQDTIVWQPGAGGRWTPINLGATQTRGLEGRISFNPLQGLSLEGSHAILSAKDLAITGATAGKTLVFKPDRASSAAIRLGPWIGLSLGLTWTFIGERFTTAGLYPNQLLAIGSKAYLVNSGDADIHELDLLGRTLTRKLNMPVASSPMTITPLEGGKGLVVNSMAKTAVFVDLATHASEKTLSLQGAPSGGVAVANGKAYVAAAIADFSNYPAISYSFSGIHVLDPVGRTVLKTIPLDNAANPFSVATDLSGKIQVGFSGGVLTIDPMTDTVLRTVPFAKNVGAIAFLSATKAYAAAGGDGLVSFDPSSGAVLRDVDHRIIAGDTSVGSFKVRGKLAYVPNFVSDTVTVIDLTTETTKGAAFQVGDGPQELAFLDVVQ